MAKKAPGKHYREGLSLIDLFRMFPDSETAENWFIQVRWGDQVKCPHCGSHNIQDPTTHPDMRFRCRTCRRFFSTKTGTVMQGSNFDYQTWAIAIFQMTTNIKGISSMKLHRDLNIAQKNAWHLAHRIRETFKDSDVNFLGPVEVDETFIGGKRRNMSNSKRKALKDTGRGAVGKATVVGIKDRETNEVTATVVNSTDAQTLHPFIGDNVDKGATVYTDDHRGYNGIPYYHESVKHSVSEYVNGMAHTNGIESFWAMLKRGYHGTYHYMSEKHLHRYVNEFAGRHNVRDFDTIEQMCKMVVNMEGRKLTFKELTK
ncbi:MAG: IS1595 family transposase [Gammaproteobacteria bacterium]|nr:IS1595 family transposase [Gammaproteobacteria bacterium]MCY4226638.1 IS1595 family transposase [Gammaproteobacteria bacterium]